VTVHGDPAGSPHEAPLAPGGTVARVRGLAFSYGDSAVRALDGVSLDVRAGEVLVIPSMVRHRAEALEDTLDVDIFNPPRQDWIDKSDNYLRTGEPMSNGGQG